jgi:hypothetical protein
MSERLKKTRIVKFEEDYKAGGRLIYAKGSEHPIHESTVETLQKQGVKFKSEKVDIDAMISKAKTEFEKSEKEAATS